MRWIRVGMLLAALAGCSTDDDAVDLEAIPDEGEIVTPPFEVRGDADGLLLVWFDEEGQHTAGSRDEIPEARRAMVRVEDLGSEDTLDPGLVYVADLTAPGGDGAYPVRRMARDRFEAAMDEASGAAARADSAELGAADAEVIIYGASWCGACRSTAAFLRERQIPFVERDVEREPGARQAMMEAARRAGVSPTGIPVIDFRGEIITGFDRSALERAIQRSRAPI